MLPFATPCIRARCPLDARFRTYDVPLMRRTVLASATLLVTLASAPAQAAAALDGTALRWPWALPFVGILLTIATGPLLFPRFWHHHYGKLALAWSLLTLVPLAASHGLSNAAAAFTHSMLAEYLSFIVLLFTLYVVAGGILITANLRGTPLVNTGILGFGTLIASVVGTTGAAMILIRPLLRANETRSANVHVVVFFIFLVANIGGALSPLGDPPLFVGFLHGIDFFWTTRNLWFETALVAILVLTVFLLLDLWLYRQDRLVTTVGEAKEPNLRVSGGINLILIAGVITVILACAIWNPGISFSVYGTTMELQGIARDVALLLIAVLSLVLTPNEHREANGFTWEPIIEVGILFAGIFTCIIPVLAALDAGKDGAFGWLLEAVTQPNGRPNDAAYFWLTGALSAFLDNAPTYLVFFELAGGNAQELMGPLATTLKAISMGAVYMGALTYIGNAPNFMVYAIALERGVKMPSFFGYMAWSMLVLLPIFALLTFVSIARPW
jgi:Na+/H+ antiporter NhaD/arsenite permease-like protein